MDKTLYYALIGLARALAGYCTPTAETWQTVLQALTADGDTAALVQAVREEKRRLAPDCAVCTHPCGRTADADPAAMENEPSPVCAAKAELLAALQKYAKGSPDVTNPDVQQKITKCLFVLGEPFTPEELDEVRREELAGN